MFSALTTTQLGPSYDLTEVSALPQHAIEKRLRDAGRLSYVQFQLLTRLNDAHDGQRRMTDLAADHMRSTSPRSASRRRRKT